MRAVSVLPAGSWHADGREIDQVLADYDGRHRRRVLFVLASGNELLLDLAQTTHLRHGDGLLVEGTGEIVRVIAAPERLLSITADDDQGLIRLAWHLGNRHLPTMVGQNRLFVRYDHVIADMLVGLGAQITQVTDMFDPEGGAYAKRAHKGGDGAELGPHGHAHS